MILIYVTHKNKKAAKKVVAHLLEKRLIACANIYPIDSIYRWEGKVVSDSEYVTLLKTQKKNWKKLKAEVKKIHPYDVPCIIKIKAEANKAYANWIINETRL